LEELIEFIGAADIYLTPYLNKALITLRHRSPTQSPPAKQ